MTRSATATTHPHRAPLRITWNGAELDILPDKAVYRADLSTLYVADIHLGKPEHFRAAGAPVPETVTAHDLTRLNNLLGQTSARRLVVLGDLFHARVQPEGTTLDQLRRWRARHMDLRVLLIRGNHDRHAGDPPGDLGVESFSGPTADPDNPADPIHLVHEPEQATAATPCLAGHIHPAVRLPQPGRQWSAKGPRSPCFWFQSAVAVLPAFGRFTGAACVQPTRGDRVVVTDSSTLVDVTAAFSTHGPRLSATTQSSHRDKKSSPPRA